MSKLSVTHPSPLLLSSASPASHNIFTELQRTNYFQWWSCHFGAFARKNILPWEEHTTDWHVFLLFGREENERGILVLSFVLWYFYKFKTMSFSCHNSLKSKLTWAWHYENTFPDKINSKRTDTRTYSLMYALKMETIACMPEQCAIIKGWSWSLVSALGNYLKMHKKLCSVKTWNSGVLSPWVVLVINLGNRVYLCRRSLFWNCYGTLYCSTPLLLQLISVCAFSRRPTSTVQTP